MIHFSTALLSRKVKCVLSFLKVIKAQVQAWSKCVVKCFLKFGSSFVLYLFLPSPDFAFILRGCYRVLDFVNLGVGMGRGKERQEPYFVIIQRGEICIVAETHRSQLWLPTLCEALIRLLKSWYIRYSGFTFLARDTFCFPSMTLLACSSPYWQRCGCCYYTALVSDIDEIKAEKLHYTFFFFFFIFVKVC